MLLGCVCVCMCLQVYVLAYTNMPPTNTDVASLLVVATVAYMLQCSDC